MDGEAAQATPSPTKRHRDENQRPSGPDVTSPLGRREATTHRICVTGGPCAGKSTFLAMLQNTVEERTGVKVFCVPEAATLLVTGGLKWTPETALENQLALLKTQIALEDAFFAIAKATKQPALVVCDRGVMDGRAYCSPEEYDEILRRAGYKLEQLRDQRYDVVLHLVTAAIGAASHYNMDNPARFESVEGAVNADLHLRNMYLGHPHVCLVDNSGGTFQAKMDKAIDIVYETIGHTRPKHRSRRFLVSKPPNIQSIPVPTAAVDIVITVLSGSDPHNVKLLLRRSHGNEDSSYLYYNPCRAEDNSRTELRHMLSPREYATLMGQRDPNHDDIVKRGVSFTYEGHFYELSVFQTPAWVQGQGLLYVSCDEDDPKLPPWITVDRDTSEDAAFSSYALSLKR